MILVTDTFNTNAELMLACGKLGYLDGYGMDVTYGKGTWWKANTTDQPTVCHDILLDGVDFRDLPHADDTFDWVAFDPPYVSTGGRTTSTIEGFNDAYALSDAPRNPDELHTLMVDGLISIWRVLKPKGLVLFKCMNYVTSGKYRTAAYDVLNDVLSHQTTNLDRANNVERPPLFRLRAEFIHLHKPGPQPSVNPDGSPRTQMHARRNYSHLFCLEARK